MEPLAYFEGQVLPAREVRIPILDRGFLFGDGIYEVVRTYGGRPFLMDRHLDRLEESGNRLRIGLPPRTQILAAVESLLSAAECEESYIRIIFTRGDSVPNIDTRFASVPRMALIQRSLEDISAPLKSNAVSVHIRRCSRTSLDPSIKSGNYLNNIMALMEAQDSGGDEALMMNDRGELTEAPTSNIFLVKGDRVQTPSLDSGILAGITREFLIERATAEGIPVEETRLHVSDLNEATEIFLTSTLREVRGVDCLDGRLFGKGAPGTMTSRLHEVYRRGVASWMSEEK